MPKSTRPSRGRASSKSRSLVPTKPQFVALAVPERLILGGHEIHPEQILNIPDRRALGDGPWRDEPDRVAWTDTATGYACLILRQPDGTLAGFVAVGSSHPLWCYERDAIPPELGIAPHQGIDYAALCDENASAAVRICHTDYAYILGRARPNVPSTSNSDASGGPDAWWLGFNCNKTGDFLPNGGYRNNDNREDGPRVYRDIGYVADQVLILADKLKALGDHAPSVSGDGVPGTGVPLVLEPKPRALLPRKGGRHE